MDQVKQEQVVAARVPAAWVEHIDAVARERGGASRASVVRELLSRALQQETLPQK